MDKEIPYQHLKESFYAVVLLGKTKTIRREKEYLMIEGSILQGDTRTLSVYSLYNRTSKYMK